MQFFDSYQYDSSTPVGTVVGILIVLVLIAATWQIYEKAGEEGWKSVIPIYRSYIYYRIAMGDGWLFILGYIPIIGFVMRAVACYSLSRSFGHGLPFAVGLYFLPFIFEVYLAFGDDVYLGPNCRR